MLNIYYMWYMFSLKQFLMLLSLNAFMLLSRNAFITKAFLNAFIRTGNEFNHKTNELQEKFLQ